MHRPICIALGALVLTLHGAWAQQPGQVRRNLEPVAPPAAEEPAAPAPVLDLREEMRKLVAGIAGFARRHKPDFVVVVAGVPDLLVKDGETEDQRPPARAYMRSIDGILLDGLFFGPKALDEPPAEERQQRMLALAGIARENGLKVLVMDYAKERDHIRTSFRDNAKLGFVSFAAPAPVERLNRLPGYWKTPWGNNADSVVSLPDVRNFVYLADSSPFGRPDEFALAMHETNFDMVVVDVFHGRKPLDKRAVDTLRYKKMGSRRLALARVNVGTAASYHYYWKDGWREGAPDWIAAPIPTDPDRYYVKYWDPEWQKILFGGTDSFVYGVVRQGYDGMVLTGLESVFFFEGGQEAVAERR
ncbi:MAG: hypothetical protein H6907_22190 [Hyphomicrobiales bacterium]|nr:hypothetical protein [Hyphomicrobiales bacterium]